MNIKRPVPYILSLLLLCPLMFYPKLSSAQQELSTSRLNSIYQQMYREGNENFVFVKAIRDGLAEPQGPCSFMYSAGNVMINEKQLQEPFLTEYALLVRAFLASQGNNGQGLLQMVGVTLSPGDILNSTSHFRKHKNIFATGDKVLNSDFVTINNPLQEPTQQLMVTTTGNANLHTVTAYSKVEPICTELIKDRLVDPAKGYAVLYNSNGIFINEVKMDNAAATKYRQLFKEDLHFEADSPLASYKFTRRAKKTPADEEKTDIQLSPGKN